VYAITPVAQLLGEHNRSLFHDRVRSIEGRQPVGTPARTECQGRTLRGVPLGVRDGDAAVGGFALAGGRVSAVRVVGGRDLLIGVIEQPHDRSGAIEVEVRRGGGLRGQQDPLGSRSNRVLLAGVVWDCTPVRPFA